MTLDEFFEKLWFGYPSDLCHKKPGVKQKAYIAAKKINPDQYETILKNTEALKRYDRQDTKPDRWPHCSTYLNQAYYDRPLGTVMELKQKREAQICSKEGCNEEAIGERFRVCAKHTEIHENRLNMMKILKDLGIARPGQSLQELSAACREYLLTSEASGKLLNKLKMDS